jgi:Ribonuclease P 40kDa (Rpp40) subunit
MCGGDRVVVGFAHSLHLFLPEHCWRAALTVHGFVDAPISWSQAEHEHNEIGGEHGYTLLLTQDGGLCTLSFAAGRDPPR